MKNLLITLFLITPVCFADWGDVYYCEMTSYSDTSNEGNVTNYKLEKFKFKLDREKQAMVHGKGGYFNGTEHNVNPSEYRFMIETWEFSDSYVRGSYREGKFLYSAVFFRNITTVTASCEKF